MKFTVALSFTTASSLATLAGSTSQIRGSLTFLSQDDRQLNKHGTCLASKVHHHHHRHDKIYQSGVCRLVKDAMYTLFMQDEFVDEFVELDEDNHFKGCCNSICNKVCPEIHGKKTNFCFQDDTNCELDGCPVCRPEDIDPNCDGCVKFKKCEEVLGCAYSYINATDPVCTSVCTLSENGFIVPVA